MNKTNLVTITAEGPTRKDALENLANQLPSGAPEDLDIKVAKVDSGYKAAAVYNAKNDPAVRSGTGATPSVMSQYRKDL